MSRRAVLAAALAATLGAAALPAVADGYAFEITYRASLSGLTIGRGSLVGTVNDDTYRYDAQGRTAGLAGLFSSYIGAAVASGRLGNGGHVDPERFAISTQGRDEARAMRVGLAGGSVRDVAFEPDVETHDLDHPARVAVTEAHMRGVVDPMSAFVVPDGYVDGDFRREACERVIPVFSGRARFDVALEFRSVRTVSSAGEGGYAGPVMVCGAAYRPISGHRSDRDGVKYMAERGDMEVLLAPVADTGLLVPYRVTVRTPYGPGVLQAISLDAAR